MRALTELSVDLQEYLRGIDLDTRVVTGLSRCLDVKVEGGKALFDQFVLSHNSHLDNKVRLRLRCLETRGRRINQSNGGINQKLQNMKLLERERECFPPGK